MLPEIWPLAVAYGIVELAIGKGGDVYAERLGWPETALMTALVAAVATLALRALLEDPAAEAVTVSVQVSVTVTAGGVTVTVTGPTAGEDAAEAERGTLRWPLAVGPGNAEVGPPDGAPVGGPCPGGKIPDGMFDVAETAATVWLKEAPPETPEGV